MGHDLLSKCAIAGAGAATRDTMVQGLRVGYWSTATTSFGFVSNIIDSFLYGSTVMTILITDALVM